MNAINEHFARNVMPFLGELCRSPKPETPREQAIRLVGAALDRRHAERRASAGSAALLQEQLLNLAQLEAMKDIQDALKTMAVAERAINQLIAMHRLPLRAMVLTQPGWMMHEMDIALSHSDLAEAKLLRGGLPLHAEPLSVAATGREEQAA
ncbi:hypothetical protein [Chromobacterium sphagni]|uniref:Uncharacterized protein n=1 Tax=Chromobacterium sphagni TaxID=1903179 RepID=A0ABX3CE46_9NEIS|nr:hypothetical protein [Chromobacterium sphagni]OHX20414.1 hypothetical protein BI344_08045 [Chromobacterium sphagni]